MTLRLGSCLFIVIPLCLFCFEYIGGVYLYTALSLSKTIHGIILCHTWKSTKMSLWLAEDACFACYHNALGVDSHAVKIDPLVLICFKNDTSFFDIQGINQCNSIIN